MKLVEVSLRRDTKVTYAVNLLLPLVSVSAILAFSIAVFCQEPYSSHLSNPIEVFCTANGDLRVISRGQTSQVVSSPWDPSLLLSITLGFGRITYAAAKGIDICWDLIVGRLGQPLLAFLAYLVLRRSLQRYMDNHCVDFRVFSSLSFDKVSPAALWATTCSVFKDRRQHDSMPDIPATKCGWRFRWQHFGHFVILAYILGFSTLASIMTGYQSALTPYVRRSDNHTLVELSQLESPNFVIVDGSRVGLNDYYPIHSGQPLSSEIRGCKYLT